MLTSIPNSLKPVKGCQKIVNTEGHTEKILHVFKKRTAMGDAIFKSRDTWSNEGQYILYV